MQHEKTSALLIEWRKNEEKIVIHCTRTNYSDSGCKAEVFFLIASDNQDCTKKGLEDFLLRKSFEKRLGIILADKDRQTNRISF